MPLNKLDSIIKNTEGRILYVSPSDLDSTDSIENSGNSLARPFKTLQRALIESARFSYIKGNSNDEILNQPLGDDLELRQIIKRVAKHYLLRAEEQSTENPSLAYRLVGLSNHQTFRNWYRKYAETK